ncbi:class I SAM-dependent methyltransferase [Arenibacter latericius]|uniref:class I SAM-dependent methyltransferase n=1 Tax=Arenibacter latericius TaxID=86104 RepID=UPI000408A53D|nr:class I SAM-dependent methyltransferase [Arenibacter latericius]
MSVLLKDHGFKGVTSKEIVQQIEAKNKCKEKLPTWFRTPLIYYPEKLNLEQTSSETTAQYKAEICNGKSLLDLTGGLGVDSYYFSQKIDRILHCEINPKLAEIAAYNFKILDRNNIETFASDGIEYLKNSDTHFNWIYVDPSRRNDAKGKVFMLADCLPNVPENLALLFASAKNIMIKTAPLLDITAGIRELNFVKEIHVIAVKNEVKELLWILERSYQGEIRIKTVNLTSNDREAFNFILNKETTASPSYSEPQRYLYEPNSAILKAGAFKTVSESFEVHKLHEHSHLYTSNQLLEFPGRRFTIKGAYPYNKKAINSLKINKANITTRNFPVSVSDIRKKFKIKDGGDTYLFFTTDLEENKIVLKCTKA